MKKDIYNPKIVVENSHPFKIDTCNGVVRNRILQQSCDDKTNPGFIDLNLSEKHNYDARNSRKSKPECKNQSDLHGVQRLKFKNQITDHHSETFGALDVLQIYFSYFLLLVTGYFKALRRPIDIREKNREGYVPLYSGFESFHTQHLYRPVKGRFMHPIGSIPGEYVKVMERVTHDYGWSMKLTGKSTNCVNFGSYNYLGFAQNHGPCTEDAIKTLNNCGTSVCSSRRELGNGAHLEKLDKLVAKFVGTEDAITCAMGYATNTLNLPIIITKGCLVLSDEKNHVSIILGLRLSGAKTQVFKHNDMNSLEKLLREGILNGQPRTGLPWEKIFIVVEGVYSMEGSIVQLPEILSLKKKYEAYVYLDEAHSIGAIGSGGRGIVEYWGEQSKDIDILMGTFTKSFGSAGGYIAGSHDLIQLLREGSHAQCYGTAMSPPVAQQILTSMEILMGQDGTNVGIQRIRQLACNSRYFRQKLKQKGFIVYGHADSPVVPVALFTPVNILYTADETLRRGVVTVCTGYPVTGLTEARARFCVSAAHTKEMLDHAIRVMSDIGKKTKICKSVLVVDEDEVHYEKVLLKDIE